MYADDASLFLSNTDLSDLDSDANIAHNSVLSWFSANKLLCNTGKVKKSYSAC